MTSFERMCRMCFGEAIRNCPGCGGTGRVKRDVTVPVKIATDNREPRPFRLVISSDGTMTFIEAGRRKGVSTSVQSAFNRARLESANINKPKRVRRFVKRGLLAAGKGR